MAGKINFTIDYSFFLKSINFLKNLCDKMHSIEQVLNCDIYGGPLDEIYTSTLDMWEIILKSKEEYDIFLRFVNLFVEDRLPFTETNFYYCTKATPTIGEIVLNTSKTKYYEDDYYQCLLCKPTHMEWPYFIWSILTGEDNDNN